MDERRYGGTEVEAAAGAKARDGVARRILGLPLTVLHTAPLPRVPTDEEWARLLADAGAGPDEGVRASVEPTPDGHRLRLEATKEGAARAAWAGLAVFGLAAILLAAGLLMGRPTLPPIAAIMAAVGIGTIAYGALPLPAWAATRLGLMERAADRLVESMAAPPHEG